MSGFIRLERDAFDHHILKDPIRFHAWFWLVAMACWKARDFDVNGKTIRLTRGQLCVSRGQLADAWGWSPSAVERFLTRLKTEQMIGRETGQGRSIITIRNYDKFNPITAQTGQDNGQEAGQRPDSDRTANKQGNKETNKNTHGAGARPDDVPETLWADFVALRRAKRAPLTDGAVKGLRREAEKAGWSMQEVIQLCVTNGWQGFQARYVEDQRAAGDKWEYTGP